MADDARSPMGNSPWYQPRTKSQARAWSIATIAILIGLLVWLVPVHIDGDETAAREVFVVGLLGLFAVLFATYVIDRLRLQAGGRIAATRALPWRKSLKEDESARRLTPSDKQLEPRLRLPEVDLHEASLPGVDLQQADLTEASLRNAELTAASLQGADLTGADLRGADLRRGDLAETTWTGASLEGARLEQADLAGADLRTADLRDISLKGASYDDRTVWPDDFSPADAGAERVEPRNGHR